MKPGFAKSPIAWIVHRAALSAPETICDRLEEEWLADLSSLEGAVVQFRFALGCCRAALAIRCDKFATSLSKTCTNVIDDLPPGRPRTWIRFPFSKKRHRLREDAYTWLERLRRGLREEEGPALQAWLRPRSHRALIARTAAQRIGPEDLAALQVLFHVDPSWVVPRHGRGPTVNVAAGLIAAGMASLALLYTHHSIPGLILGPGLEGSFMEAQGTAYSSGEHTLRRLVLPDGTRVVMNRGTRVAVLYAEGTRSVMLVRGEATFTVQRQALKSFYLTVGDRLFSTKNSTFNVRLTRSAIELTVLDGIMRLAPGSHTGVGTSDALRGGDERPSVPTLVEAGQSLDARPGTQSARILTQSEAEARIVWQRG